MQLVQTITVGAGGASSIEFTAIPQDATDLLVVLTGRVATGSAFGSTILRFNGISTATYRWRYLLGDGSTASSASNGAGATTQILVGNHNDNTSTASTFSSTQVYIPNYAGSSAKTVSADSVAENNATASRQFLIAGEWSETSAVTSLALIASGTNWEQNSSASLYKITRA